MTLSHLKDYFTRNVALWASILVALLLFAMASMRYSGFFGLAVIANLIDDNAFLGIAAVGMTFVIISGGIDLSVGSMIALSSIASAVLIEAYHWPPALVFPVILLFGAAFGSFMGWMIAKFEIAPFLVTLAGMFFLRGFAYTLSQESIPLRHSFFQWFLSGSLSLGSATLRPTALIFLFVVGAGIYLTLYTKLGRSMFAIGGSSLSSALMGLRVQRTQIYIYLLSGTLSALAGLVYAIYTSSGNSTAAMGAELDVIAAVVIGGTLLTGGRGSVFGTLVGIFILGIIQTIITFEGTLSSWWSRIVIGALLLSFVGLQRIVTVAVRRPTR